MKNVIPKDVYTRHEYKHGWVVYRVIESSIDSLSGTKRMRSRRLYSSYDARDVRRWIIQNVF